MTAPRRLDVRIERYPLAGEFRISRGAKTEAVVVVAEIAEGGCLGRGECVPYARYGETVEGVAEAVAALAPDIAAGLDLDGLQARLPPGAARNALDCALWDLQAKLTGIPAWQAAGLEAPPGPAVTAYTLSIAAPAAMAEAARTVARPLLKLKLAGDGQDLARVEAVRGAARASRLIVDANEGWTRDELDRSAPAYAALGVEMIEQPLPAAADDALAGYAGPVPLGADESVHGLHSLDQLRGRYRIVNVKLDKTGGLTEALALVRAARAAGLEVMVGCMVGTSLAMAPALLLTGSARYVDLDGPLLLAADRAPGLRYSGSTVFPAEPGLWG